MNRGQQLRVKCFYLSYFQNVVVSFIADNWKDDDNLDKKN